jgi:hypothetical protein
MADEQHKMAKADARAEKARAKALRPWWKKKRVIIPGAIVALAIISAAAGGGADKSSDDTSANNASDDTTAATASDAATNKFSTNSEHKPEDDVELLSCSKTVIDTIEAQLRVTNHSSKESNYTISLGVEDGNGTKVGDGFASTNNVNPGQVAMVKGIATLDSPSATVKCKIEEVERFSS